MDKPLVVSTDAPVEITNGEAWKYAAFGALGVLVLGGIGWGVATFWRGYNATPAANAAPSPAPLGPAFRPP